MRPRAAVTEAANRRITVIHCGMLPAWPGTPRGTYGLGSVAAGAAAADGVVAAAASVTAMSWAAPPPCPMLT